jgi:protein AATF/BFR2
MRADDIEALRKYRRKKNNVDRKASKGRKIRYTVHDKLQNFMFPIPTVNPSSVTIDSDRLFASLFQ